MKKNLTIQDCIDLMAILHARDYKGVKSLANPRLKLIRKIRKDLTLLMNQD